MYNPTTPSTIVVTSIVGLVVEYTVAIGVTRVRFPDDAFFEVTVRRHFVRCSQGNSIGLQISSKPMCLLRDWSRVNRNRTCL